MRAYLGPLLYTLLAYHFIPAARSRTITSSNAIAVFGNVDLIGRTPFNAPKTLDRRVEVEAVFGLPPGWHGIFRTLRSIQPPLPVPVFSQLFLGAYRAVQNDRIPERSYRQFKYGALLLEFVASSPQGDPRIVTKEIVEATALWLHDAAQKGWTDFFEAWVVDKLDREVIYIHVANVWDTMVKPTLDELLEGLLED